VQGQSLLENLPEEFLTRVPAASRNDSHNALYATQSGWQQRRLGIDDRLHALLAARRGDGRVLSSLVAK
jgi:hypothetical protein